MVTQIGELLSQRNRPVQVSSADIWKELAHAVGGMDFDVYVQLMNDLWEGAGRNGAPGPTLLKMWYQSLGRLTPAELARAIAIYVNERSKEYLSCALLLEIAGKSQQGDIVAIAAWDEVLTEIKRVGAYQTPRFTDRRTAAAIRHLGGWVALCDTAPEELHKWTRQTFLKTFNAMPVTAEARLTNLIEQENARTGQIEAAKEVQRRIEAGRQSVSCERGKSQHEWGRQPAPFILSDGKNECIGRTDRAGKSSR